MKVVGDFFDHVFSVAWMADVGLPLLATLGGIWVAVSLVGRQLRADREFRDADRLKQHLRVLTAQLQLAAERLRSEDLTSDFWHEDRWPDADAVTDAIRRSIPHQAPDARRQAVRVSAATAAAWREIASRERRSPRLSSSPVRPRRRSAAVRDAMAPLAATLERLAMTIEAWDGRGTQPLLGAAQLRSLALPPSAYADEFEASLTSQTPDGVEN